MSIKPLYLFEEFIKEFPDRSFFTDKNVGHELNERIEKNQPIEFLPNNPNEGSFPNLEKKQWDYGIAMFGVLTDGRRAIVLIDGIAPFFYIEMPPFTVGQTQLAVPPEIFAQTEAMYKNSFIFAISSMLNESGIKNSDFKLSWHSGKPFSGWQAEMTQCVKIELTKQTIRKKAMKLLREKGCKTYHDDHSNYYRVVARDYQLPLCSWTTISEYKIESLEQFKQPIFRVNINNIKKYDGEILKNPLLARDKSMIITWDIECATRTGKLPTPDNTNDKLFMIAATAHWWYSKEALVKICFVDSPTEPSDKYVTVVCGHEAYVIMGFALLFAKLTPDFVTGFNTSDFDYPWLIQRCYQYGMLESFCDTVNEIRPIKKFKRGTPNDLGHKFYSTTFDYWRRMIESKNYIPKPTTNNYLAYVCPIYYRERVKIDAQTMAEGTQLQTAGCISFDLMVAMKQAYPNSEVATLNHFLSINKLGGKKDMPVAELFRIYWESVDLIKDMASGNISPDQMCDRISKSKHEMREVAEYCVIDSYRCQELSLIRNVIADRREMANLSYTTLTDAFLRANGMKVKQIAMARGIERNILFTTVNIKDRGKDKYPGAYVFPPKQGLIASKFTIGERIEKHRDFTNKFGFNNLNDGSLRTVPFPDLATFGNPNNSSAETQNTEDVIKLKITSFQNAIHEYAAENKEFTLSEISPEYVDKLIEMTNTSLACANIDLSLPDIRIFTEFLCEKTGRPITGLDFSSLYPSLIMAYNLSPEYTISMETCNGSIIDVNHKCVQAISLGHKLRKIKFNYGESKTEITGFFISHENQFPYLDDGKTRNPNCKLGLYPTILKELLDSRNVMKKPKEYYETLNEYLEKLNDDTNKANLIIKLCSSAYPESCLILDEFKDFDTLTEEYEELKIIKDDPKYKNMQWGEFVEFMKSGPLMRPEIERIELKDAITVIINKIDYDYTFKPPKKIGDTAPDKVKKILCAFEDEDVINAKGGITWEDIEFYFNYFDAKQKALKVFMNTFYGESGNKQSSMFLLTVAGSITTQGQMNIKMVKEFVENGFVEYEGKRYDHNIGKFSVKYGDTDSLYIAAPEAAFRDIDIEYYSGRISKEKYWTEMVNISFDYVDKIKKDVNRLLAETSGGKFLKMSYEEVIFPVIFLAKKKYYGIPHISIPNFNPKKLFIKGLEIKKMGVSGVLKNLCGDLMWKSMRLDNYKELIELTYDTIEEFYKKTWDVELFGQSKQYRPNSEEDIASGKGNPTVIRFVERMKARGIEIKPHERFRTVIVQKYPFEYDYRGRKVPLKIGDFMEFVQEAKEKNMTIDIDYYMEHGIIGQLARIAVYREEFFVPSVDDTDEELKKANDASFKNAKQHLNAYASKYYKIYQNKGPVYQNTFRMINKSFRSSYKNMGMEKLKIDLLCADWEHETPESFFKDMCVKAEAKAIKKTAGYGNKYLSGLNKNPEVLTTLQKMFCGTNAQHMMQVIMGYNNNLTTLEREFRNMFNDFVKFINEHRKAIDLISEMINKTIGIDQLMNDPVDKGDLCNELATFDSAVFIESKYETPKVYQPHAKPVIPLFDLNVEAMCDELADDAEDSKLPILDTIKDKIPEKEANELFKQVDNHLKQSFNVCEIANRLHLIYDNLYKNYLCYRENMDLKSAIEKRLDKIYRVGVTVNKATVKTIVDENVEKNIRDNIIEYNF